MSPVSKSEVSLSSCRHNARTAHAPRPLLAGACLMGSGLALAAGGFTRMVPSEAPAGALMRVLDPLAPWFLALGGICALTTLLLSFWAHDDRPRS
jgi:hypothetical protein